MPIMQLNATTYEATLLGGDKVEIGNREAIDFIPHLKLNRWDGECFVKVALPTVRKIAPIIEDEKVKWVEQDIEAHFYPLEPRTVIAKDKEGNDIEFIQNELGGFEFEVILKKKPKTNQIILNIETQGLVFYYQPPLTQQEIDEGCIRPDNVVGSYAVYHATRTNVHRGKADAEKYKCGKAFHIYRPKITDATGKWVWADLKLDEVAGTLITTIPQDFLDNAVYPVSTGTSNFGYETTGSDYDTTADTDVLTGSLFTSPVDAGTGISMSACAYGQVNIYGKGVLVLHDNLNIVENGVGNAVSFPYAKWSWRTSTFAISPTLLPSTEYVLCFIFNKDDSYLKFDTGDANQGHKDATNSYTSPINPTDAAHSTRKYSIYCTYEEIPAVVAPTVTTQAVTDIEIE